MRQLLTFALIMLFATSAMAITPDAVQPLKGTTHVTQNGSNDRTGGDNMADAVAITALPYADGGNTCGLTDAWDEVCPYTGSLSPDAWYSYTAAADMSISIDLIGSTYDTKTYVLDMDYNVIACNDDFYSDYVSFIENAALTAGMTYYIVVDGYGSACGDYALAVTEFTPPPPCIVACDGFAEGEPDNGPGYVDGFNSGCNGVDQNRFSDLVADDAGNLTVCGVGGWTDTGKDTDWYRAIVGASGTVSINVEFEVPGWFFQISPTNCVDAAIAQEVAPLACEVASMTINGVPGEEIWLWAGAQEFAPPAGFAGYNFNYRMELSGLQEGPVATEPASWDGIKSMYR
jgi:hypothetical protein|nr:PPC domain-containing protein [Candidatus Krumholzibacteria bacterium]